MATLARAARARTVGRRIRDGSTLGRRSMRWPSPPALHLRAPSPPSPHTRLRLACRPHSTMRSTPRTQPIARHASHAAHCAPPAQHTHARGTTNSPTRREAAVQSARRRLALASGSRIDRAAQRTTRHARNTLRASLHTHAPDRTARCAAHHARNTLRAVRFARRPYRNIARRLLITREYAQPKRPNAPQRSGPPARRRLALASGSCVDRTAQRATRHARSTLRAFLTHTHTQRSPSATSERSPSATKTTSAPTRHDTAGPLARRRLVLTSGSRADRTARRAARAKHRAPSASHRLQRNTPRTRHPERHPIHHTHAHHNAPACRDAARPPSAPAASHSLPARAPTAPYHAQHTRTQHTARHASHAAHCAPPAQRTHTRKITNARTRRGAAVLQPAAASRSLLARAPTALHHTQHIAPQHVARHASHEAHCAPPARHTCARKTTDAPTRRDAAGSSARRQSHSLTSRAPTAPHMAQHTARALHATHTTWRAARSHTRTHTIERSDAPRAARSQPTAASHSLPARASTAPHSSLHTTHQLIARLLLIIHAHTQPRATRHARNTMRAIRIRTMRSPSAAHHSARQAPRPGSHANAAGLPAARLPPSRPRRPHTSAKGMPATRLLPSPGTPPHRPPGSGWWQYLRPGSRGARKRLQTTKLGTQCPRFAGEAVVKATALPHYEMSERSGTHTRCATASFHPRWHSW